MQKLKFDLVVIGGGAAGEKGASQAAYFGKKVALVERDIHLGGATAGTTVPSKTLRETSLSLSGYRARKLYGVDLSLRRHATVQDFLRHEKFVKKTERKRVLKNMIHHNVEIIHGSASFLDSHTIRVEAPQREPVVLTAEVILIATGSSPRRPTNFPCDDRIYDSDSILQIQSMPRSLVVIGGGVIGCEYACIFAAVEVDVYLVHSRNSLLHFLDTEIATALQQSMRLMGVHMAMPEAVARCEPRGDGISVLLESGTRLEPEAVMLATGRQSNTQTLNLEAAGIALDRKGLIDVDEDYRVVHPETGIVVEGVYASGDVIGAPSLASTSMEQARFAMIKAFNLDPYKEAVAPILPVGVYTIPECSGAGLTEAQCRQQQIPYIVGKGYYGQVPRGMIIGDFDGFLKLIYRFDPDIQAPMKLLGVHAIGESASELVHVGLTALMQNAGHDLFINTCFNYPTLGELYKYATYDAMGRRDRKMERVHTTRT